MSVLSFLRLFSPSTHGGGVNLRTSNVFGASSAVDPLTYYTPGTGNPAISAADYYHMDGIYWFRCYDLNLFGTTGQGFATSRGRYFWLCSPDHPNSTFGWGDGQEFMGGYSSDPGVFPTSLSLLFRWTNSFIRGANENNQLYQAPWLVYNPDDGSNAFYMYCEGSVSGGTAVSPHVTGTSHEEGLAYSNDIVSWTMNGPTNFNIEGDDWSSFQRVVRTGASNWYSFGLTHFTGGAGHGYGGYGKWTATGPKGPFTQVSEAVHDVVGNSQFFFAGTDLINIGGQDYALCREDQYDRQPYVESAFFARGALTTGAVRLGQYVSLVPVDSNFNGISSPSVIRISGKYNGDYPGPTFLQNVGGYLEDGVLHAYATLGTFMHQGISGTTNGLAYIGDSNTDDYLTPGAATHGPLKQQHLDYYTYIIDSSAAAQAAPIGVTASCAAGVVTLLWQDALPNNTYRVYRGTSAGTQATLVGDVTGVTTTNSPTVGSQYWYKVVTLQSGTERGNRVVHCYVS